jgi:hypothetical protein
MRVTLTSPVVDRHPNDEIKKSVEELEFDRENALTFINAYSERVLRVGIRYISRSMCRTYAIDKGSQTHAATEIFLPVTYHFCRHFSR